MLLEDSRSQTTEIKAYKSADNHAHLKFDEVIYAAKLLR